MRPTSTIQDTAHVLVEWTDEGKQAAIYCAEEAGTRTQAFMLNAGQIGQHLHVTRFQMGRQG